MISFFRKTRQNLLREGKVFKYIKYAIGEILLVVIGILIALQINNWNEERISIQTQDAILKIIRTDLLRDISEFQSVIKRYKEVREPIFDSVLNKRVNSEKQATIPNLTDAISGYKDVSISTRGIDLINQFPSNSSNSDASITADTVSFYNIHLVEIENAQKELSDSFQSNNNHFQNYKWFAAFYLERNPPKEVNLFFKENFKAKNKLAYFSVLFNIYVEELKNFNNNAKNLVLKIDEHLDSSKRD